MPDWLWFVMIGGPVWLGLAAVVICWARAAALCDRQLADALRRRR